MEPFCHINISEGNNDYPSYYLAPDDDKIFSIEVDYFRYVTYVYLDDQETILEYMSSQTYTFDRDLFLSEEFGPNLVISMCPDRRRLCASPGFIQSVIAPDIMSFAQKTRDEPRNIHHKVINLMIQVVHHEVDDFLYTLNFKPASSSSIQDLERTTWGGGKKKRRFTKEAGGSMMSSDKGTCTICLDEFLRGDEVASMPCGHVYHDACIVKWLETSHFCPLCRYQMPS